ncbi:MAG: cell division protein CrgA [Candidatus Nanopelagicales bacterium]|nr:cell division protein CrgA [Candidatus Nanopelagicales bacterium]
MTIVPESKRRKKDVGYTPPPSMGERKVARLGSPAWLAPMMVICFLVGLLYIVVFYIAGSQVPIMRDLSNLVNIAIGFGFIIVGFVLSTKWQ